MKKTLLSLLILGSISLHQVNGQTAPERRFDATYATGGTYTPLSSGALDAGFDINWDDDVSDEIALPFPFKYQNVLVAHIKIETYGSLLLNGLINQDFELGHIAGINMDYASGGRGKILYENTGLAGNQIFKVEFQNVSRFVDDNNVDTLNFQIWLHENGNIIEYRAGYCNVPDSAFAINFLETMAGKEALLCGIMCNEGDELKIATEDMFAHAVTRQENVFADTTLPLTSLILGNIDAANAIVHGTYPPEGSVIRFAPKATSGVSAIDFDMAAIYPNPTTNGEFNVSIKEIVVPGAMVYLFDVSGKLISSQKLQLSETKIDLGNNPPGAYFGKIKNGNREGIFKITKL